MKINGGRVSAHLDTGAQITCVALSCAQRLGLPITPSSQQACGFDGQVVKSVGQVRGATVEVVGRGPVRCNLVVFELSSGTELLLGQDLYPRLGIGVAGIPTSFPGDVRPANDEFVCSPRPKAEIPPSPEEAAALDAAIASALARNLATAGGMCSHPQALVDIDTGSSSPVNIRQYPIPRKYREEVAAQVQKWKAQGVVVSAPKGCRWNSPLLCVPKKDADGNKTNVRVCLDPRPINDLFPSDGYTVPLISDVLEELAGCEMFSSLDLEWSYHQFPISAADQQKTAFTFGDEHLMFVGAPFGLKHLPSAFQRVSADVLRGSGKTYVDDVAIATPGGESLALRHGEQVVQALDRLTEFKLTVNRDKCFFGYRALRILGNLVS
jgi:hypothetical protein